MFKVEVTEVLSLADGEPESTIVRYSQTVDALDLPKLIAAVNARPRKPRERKGKAETK